MPLEDIDIGDAVVELSPDAEAFVVEAERRIDLYFRRQPKLRVPRFVISDARRAYRALYAIREKQLALGDRFCEWGSGFGVITSLAALLGFDARGIEIEETLVAEAKWLAADFHIESQFDCDSYIPDGYDYATDGIGNTSALSEGVLLPSASAYRGACAVPDNGVEEYDVIYVFPWPGEAELIEELFDARAAAGALLVTYDENDGVVVQRRVV